MGEVRVGSVPNGNDVASPARPTRYLIVVQEARGRFAAHCPDVEGCVATGTTRGEVEERIGRVLEFHLCDLRHRQGEIPSPSAYATYLDFGRRTRVTRE